MRHTHNACTHIHMHACMHTRTHTHMFTCMHIIMHMHTHTYAHAHTHLIYDSLHVRVSTGDTRKDKFVKRADIYHQKYVYNKHQEGPSSENLSTTVSCSTDEPVQFVTIIPLEMAKKGNFSISLKIIHKIFSENKIVPSTS